MKNEEFSPLDLTSAQRWQLVMEGYNPLSAESVQRWLDKQPPDKTLAQTVAKVKKENLGSRLQSDREHRMLEEGKLDINAQEKKVNPRQQLTSIVNDEYGYGGSKNIDEQVRSKLNLGPRRQDQKGLDRNNGPIQTPRMINEKQLITESKTAVNMGYRNSISYLNAFINLLKSPSSQARNTLIERINTLVVTEEQIAEEQLKFYRGGIAKAEKELYAKLTKKPV